MSVDIRFGWALISIGLLAVAAAIAVLVGKWVAILFAGFVLVFFGMGIVGSIQRKQSMQEFNNARNARYKNFVSARDDIASRN